jgi:hypothetical protein
MSEENSVNQYRITVGDVQALQNLFADLFHECRRLGPEFDDDSRKRVIDHLKRVDPSFKPEPLVISAAEKAQSRSRITILLMDIDQCLYPIQDELRKFGRTKNTFLDADWGKLKARLAHEDPFGYICEFAECIYVLEAIKARVEFYSRRTTEESSSAPPKTQKRTTQKADSQCDTSIWKNPPKDTCICFGKSRFLGANRRVFFCHGDTRKDLSLKNDSKAHRLLWDFASSIIVSQQHIKNEYCSKSMKPAKVVSQINDLLCQKIQAMGLQGIPKNVRLIGFNSSERTYELCVPVYPSEDDFDRRTIRSITFGD